MIRGVITGELDPEEILSRDESGTRGDQPVGKDLCNSSPLPHHWLVE